MKKTAKTALSAIAISLFGSVAVASAADLTANAYITATVVEPARVTLQYTESAPIQMVDEFPQNFQFGKLVLSGYKSGTTSQSVNFTDTAGEEGVLTLRAQDLSNKTTFPARIFFDTKDASGESAKVNGDTSGTDVALDTSGSQTFDVKTGFVEGVVPAGVYVDDVTVTVSNQ